MVIFEGIMSFTSKELRDVSFFSHIVDFLMEQRLMDGILGCQIPFMDCLLSTKSVNTSSIKNCAMLLMLQSSCVHM